MGTESGFSGRLYSLSGSGDSSGRGRGSVPLLITALSAASSQIVPSNPNRLWLLLVNLDPANDVFLCLGNDLAVANEGIPLIHGGGWCLFNREMAWTGSIQAIAITANVTIAGMEVMLITTTPEPPSSPGNGGSSPPTKFGVC